MHGSRLSNGCPKIEKLVAVLDQFSKGDGTQGDNGGRSILQSHL
jgi:hypothetical protein